MRFAFVLNPAARSGRAARDAEPILAGARALGMDASLHATTAPGHATGLARGLAHTHDVVVAVGGDGTVHEVMGGLIGTEAAFGVLPLGTGNDLACALGMPTRLPAALAALSSAADGAPRMMDVGRVRWTEEGGASGERVFANCVGVGFDAMVATEAARYKRLGGRAAYLAATLRSLRLWRRRDLVVEVRTSGGVELTAAGEVESSGEDALFYHGAFFLCEVGNGHSIGGGILLTPEAVPDDGALDLCLARPLTFGRIARVLPLALKGAHVGEPEVSMGRAQRVSIRAVRGVLPIHADGEAVATRATRVQTEVLPGAIRALWGPGSDR
ncbi:diacylglycerol/lipid kinase family protein [Rubricoccus marinus]|uniref:DAGKc domain-containing protein n=1 Tax=Rubricoccus marinus TaxID=716817 RepID=A0A259TXC0_9BACT|nr:diacylglycerol kinase family protein [Rubricoccus marinus]OZC02198.1 hypothetical protein BSZ36_03865 [Rubricoccus marinus]